MALARNNQRKGDLVTGPLPNPRSVARHGARHPKSPLKKSGAVLWAGRLNSQSSSRSRRTAALSGFLDLSHVFDGPLGYGASRRGNRLAPSRHSRTNRERAVLFPCCREGAAQIGKVLIPLVRHGNAERHENRQKNKPENAISACAAATFSGDPSRIRTCNPRSRNPLLNCDLRTPHLCSSVCRQPK
jgi:hypothetical protein